jgi:hypothetical protein
MIPIARPHVVGSSNSAAIPSAGTTAATSMKKKYTACKTTPRNTRGRGIPIELIWLLLKEHAGDVQPSEASGGGEAKEVVAAWVAEATVRVIALDKRTKPK